LKTSDATCRIFYPGKYTTAPAFSGTGRYYLASGTYYFSGPGDVNLLGTVHTMQAVLPIMRQASRGN